MRNREMTNINKRKDKNKMAWRLLLLSASMLCMANASAVGDYEIPEPKVKLLKPKGFQVSIPDESGIQLFAFHGNLNKKMENMEVGQFHLDSISKQNGKWIYQNRKLKVKAGDVIYYWLFVIKNGIGYRLDDGIYHISDSDMYRTSKKIHKLTKRRADYDLKRFNNYGYGYGRSFPSHSSYSHGGPFDSGVGHGYGYSGHRRPGGYYGHGHGYGHNHGSFDSFDAPSGRHHYPYHHHWGGHKHNGNCHDGADSDESISNNDDDFTEATGSAESDMTELISTKAPAAATESQESQETKTEAIKSVTTEQDAEVMETTSATPEIDIRFGGKTK